MVETKVMMMKSFVLLILTGLILGACTDERGFQAKKFPTTAAEALAKQRKECNCNPGADNSATNAPAAGQQATPAPVVPKPVASATSGAPAGQQPAPAAPVATTPAAPQIQDEFIDTSAKLLSEVLDPGSTSADTFAKFRQNLTPEKSARARSVIAGLTINQGQRFANSFATNISVEIQAVINDETGIQKALVASGMITYNDKKLKEIKNKTLVNSLDGTKGSASNIIVYAVFCPLEKCANKSPLLWTILQINLNDGDPIFAVFRQELSEDGQSTIIRSSISPDPFPSFESANHLPSLDQVQAASPSANAPAAGAPPPAADATPGATRSVTIPIPAPSAADNQGEPSELKPLSSEDARKAMDEDLKNVPKTIPAVTLSNVDPSTVEGAQQPSFPSTVITDVKKTWDTALETLGLKAKPVDTAAAGPQVDPAAAPEAAAATPEVPAAPEAAAEVPAAPEAAAAPVAEPAPVKPAEPTKETPAKKQVDPNAPIGA